MNSRTEQYWKNYWGEETPPERVEAWQFGSDPDALARLVIEGKKRATCSAYAEYEHENEPLPEVGQYDIILSSIEEPVAIIRNTNVFIERMDRVPESFALKEGEGDGTYRYWWNAHETFFRLLLPEYGLEYSEDMLLVCEEFEVVDVNMALERK